MKHSFLMLAATAFVMSGTGIAAETKKTVKTSSERSRSAEAKRSDESDEQDSESVSDETNRSAENEMEENDVTTSATGVNNGVRADEGVDVDVEEDRDRTARQSDTDTDQEMESTSSAESASDSDVQTQTSTTTVERDEDDGRNLIRLGFQVGGNISNPRIQSAPSQSAEGGLWVGGILESRFLGKYIALQTELNYVQKPGHGAIDAVRLDYVEVPLHLKLKLDIADIRTFVQAGPSVGYLVHVRNGGKRAFRNLDVDFSIGAGVAFHLSQKREQEFFIAGRYATGLRDIDDGVDEWKTEGVRVSAGMLF